MQTSLVTELESLQPTALDAGQVFSGRASGKLIQGYDKPDVEKSLLAKLFLILPDNLCAKLVDSSSL
jgi:hypothetical protein